MIETSAGNCFELLCFSNLWQKNMAFQAVIF